MGFGDTKYGGSEWKLVGKKDLSAQTADFDITNIPSSSNLRLEIELTCSGSTDSLLLRFNSVSTSTYSYNSIDVGGGTGDELTTTTGASSFLVWEFSNINIYNAVLLFGGTTENDGNLKIASLASTNSGTYEYRWPAEVDLGAQQAISSINFIINGTTDSITGTIRLYARC